MKKLAKGKATGSLADYVDALGTGTLVVTSNGRPVAALVSLENVDAETLAMSTSPEFLQLIERSRRTHRSQGGRSPKDMRRRLGLAEGRKQA